MSINATLLAQMLVFAALVWFTMKYIWPALLQAMEEREARIADGLAAAEKGRHELELAERRAAELLREGKEQAQQFVNQAHKRADEIIEEAKEQARIEGERLLAAARADIEQQRHQAREELRERVAELAVEAAERVLQREIDASRHRELLTEFANRL